MTYRNQIENPLLDGALTPRLIKGALSYSLEFIALGVFPVGATVLLWLRWRTLAPYGSVAVGAVFVVALVVSAVTAIVAAMRLRHASLNA